MLSLFTRRDASCSLQHTLTLNAFFDQHYFPHVKVTKKQIKHDWSVYNTHLRAQLGSYPMQDITNPMLDVWVREQVVAGYKRSTINKHIDHLNRILNLARHWGYIPMHNRQQQNIKKLVIGDHTQRFLDKHEIERLLLHARASPHPVLYYVIHLLIHTGARVGEARLMKWCDVNDSHRIWTVPRSKNGRSRRIVLSSAAMQTLNDMRCNNERLLLSVDANSYVFTNPQTHTHYNDFYVAWRKVRANAELSDIRIHDLRHTFASLLINKGVSLYEVQTLLGHSSIQMTQRYAHLAPDRLHMRTEIVSDIINN